ncbi:MAG: hypothetical protein ACK6CP_05490 [Pseudanabaena sp.]|jgi:hypothetical protein|nr:hypothetical protein [Pseudanabaena sp. M090S1SP2A07QC]MCA6505515.1 hypothetical protein [Pseudanabaena sp. M172S2SP2A07QC]MCA6509007.1 hypothetical protein [Pseudanabaena sp. M109S1SP2A07QC]MCA6519638.1 hypothetical protein [Pseudanabaena sp. M110S1SP2A07QC]MCA6523124.1 hypothetical protein [Pseudanabaena sp. M051S1SP2A07QC]MCA6525973.1 hypothetical protein [Pseudanabaena sp. M179S2SP2A07QC]MCA6529073.1 hypothetical protein [Pseudanabaena sp. M125S2SP2A07QC]MCA6535418.1 hypothetical prot
MTMIKSRFTAFFAASALCLISTSMPLPTEAQSRDLQQFVDSIKSTEQVKTVIRGLISNLDQCGVGSCFNFNSTAICEWVAALESQVNGQIIGDFTSVGSQGNVAISTSDLSLMRDIFSQCKPTNYQYWNYSSMLDVYYVPKPEIDKKVRKALGIPLNKRTR